MDAATLALLEQIGSVLIQGVELGIKYGPALIADLKQMWALITSGTALTDEQKARAESVVQAAHAALQAQINADSAQDAITAAKSTSV